MKTARIDGYLDIKASSNNPTDFSDAELQYICLQGLVYVTDTKILWDQPCTVIHDNQWRDSETGSTLSRVLADNGEVWSRIGKSPDLHHQCAHLYNQEQRMMMCRQASSHSDSPSQHQSHSSIPEHSPEIAIQPIHTLLVYLFLLSTVSINTPRFLPSDM